MRASAPTVCLRLEVLGPPQYLGPAALPSSPKVSAPYLCTVQSSGTLPKSPE